MKEFSRTLVFLGVAAVSVLGATAAHYMNRPKPIEGFDEVGQEFYPDFKDPTAPTSMKVTAWDEATAEPRTFQVAFVDGRWTIPTHSNYPADASKRLADVSSSVIGITRDALVSRRESDFEKYGVIDPALDDPEKTKGRGQRVTLTAEDGSILADYIIGTKVETPTPSSRDRKQEDVFYYVRAPQEKSTYKARLKISLSTKFSDWIETDLLQLDPDKLTDVKIDRYSSLDQTLTPVDHEQNELARTSSTEPWKVAGIDEQTEETNLEEARTLVRNLDELKIVGVRRKPAGLRPDLTIDPKEVRNTVEFELLKRSLFGKGFFVKPNEKDVPELVSSAGKIVAATNEGVEYALHFGDVFTGTQSEIEGVIGSKSESDADEDSKKSKDANDASHADAKGAEGEAADANAGEKKDADKKEGDSKEGGSKKEELKKSRYLMVMVKFDESKLGAPRQEPVKPEPPPEATPSEKSEQKEDSKEGDSKTETEGTPDAEKNPEPEKEADPKDKASGDEDEQDDAAATDSPAGEQPAKDEPKPEAAKSEKKPEEKSDEAKPEEGTPEDKKPEEKKPDPKAEYEAALAKYKRDLEQYQNDLKLRDEKIEAGKKKAKQLNKRFGGWYYVVSAESYDGLRLARSALVKSKAKPADPAAPEGAPGTSPPGGTEETKP